VRGVLVGKGWEEEDIVEIMEAAAVSESAGEEAADMTEEDILKALGL